MVFGLVLFFAGLFIGVLIGVIVMSLGVMAKRSAEDLPDPPIEATRESIRWALGVRQRE